MKNKSEVSEAKVSARRRLVRGAFAVPAVFTLYSGGAMAQASSKLRCVANQATTPMASPVISSAQDTYVRVELSVRTSTVSPYPLKYYVEGNRLPVDRLGAGTLPLNGSCRQIDLATNTWKAASTELLVTSLASPLSSTSGKFIALRVDNTGKVIGVGTSTGSGTALGTSCWNSAMI